MGVEQGLRAHKVTDKYRNVEMLLLLAVPLSDSHWGVLAPLQGTAWERYIPCVDPAAYTEAQRGDVGKICKILVNPPRQLARRLPLACKNLQDKSCLIRSERKCTPGSGLLPFCYVAPLMEGEDPKLEEILTVLMRAWDEGRHVFVLSNPVG